MLNKLFDKKKPNNLSLVPVPPRAPTVPARPSENGSRAVKIVHPGGRSEYHYMAIPAARIIEKHPSFILARPEIFRRPWGCIVRPDEVLLPGQKFYVIPRQTVKKLRRRMKKTAGTNSGFSFESSSLVDDNKDNQSNTSVSGILIRPGSKPKARKCVHVKFYGIDNSFNKKTDFSPSDGKIGNKIEKGTKGILMNRRIIEKKRRARNENGWEPSLNSIHE